MLEKECMGQWHCLTSPSAPRGLDLGNLVVCWLWKHLDWWAHRDHSRASAGGTKGAAVSDAKSGRVGQTQSKE